MVFLGLGLLELLFMSAFFLLLIVGVTFDRRGKEDLKWWIFGLGLLVLGIWQWTSWTFFGPAHVDAVMEGTKVVTEAKNRVVLWDTIRNLEFWTPIGVYILAGLAYSIVEFFLDVRRSARFYAVEWQEHLNSGSFVPVLDESGKAIVTKKGGPFSSDQVESRKRPNSEVYDEVKSNGANSNLFNTALKLTDDFVQQYSFRNRIIELRAGSDKISVEPRINKVELADHITAWTFLWPAYAVSLILGDLMVEIFNMIADLLVKISGQFVKLSFANVFKF